MGSTGWCVSASRLVKRWVFGCHNTRNEMCEKYGSTCKNLRDMLNSATRLRRILKRSPDFFQLA